LGFSEGRERERVRVVFVPLLSLVTCDCRCHSLSLSLADERDRAAGGCWTGWRWTARCRGVWEAKFGGAGDELLWAGMHHKFTIHRVAHFGTWMDDCGDGDVA